MIRGDAAASGFRALTSRLAQDLHLLADRKSRLTRGAVRELDGAAGGLRDQVAAAAQDPRLRGIDSGPATSPGAQGPQFESPGRSNQGAERRTPISFATIDEAHAYGTRVWGATMDRLTPARKQLLHDYTRGDSTLINDALRARALFLPGVREKTAELDEIVNMQPVSEAVEVYKTIQSGRLFPDRPIGDVREGDRGEFLDFVSTAMHPDGIEGLKNVERRDVDAAIEVSPGTPAIYLGDHSATPEERELLLGRGLPFEVTTAPRMVEGRWDIGIRILPP